MVVVVVLKDEPEETFVLGEEKLVEGVFKSQVHYDVQ